MRTLLCYLSHSPSAQVSAHLLLSRAMGVHVTDETEARRIEEACLSQKGEGLSANPGAPESLPHAGALGQPFSDRDAQEPLKITLQCSISFGLRWGLDPSFLSPRGWGHGWSVLYLLDIR